jgi:phosphohistidine phosphatase
MKKLLLIRHAKATHDIGYADFERPLKPSGMEDAELMAFIVKKNGTVPQIIITSPALRTQSTADILQNYCRCPKREPIKEFTRPAKVHG